MLQNNWIPKKINTITEVFRHYCLIFYLDPVNISFQSADCRAIIKT